MSGDVVDIARHDHFGLCPVGHCIPLYLNVERDHYFYCRRHRVFWTGGSGLFSSWQEENSSVWALNQARLSTYREVEPFHRQPGDPAEPEPQESEP